MSSKINISEIQLSELNNACLMWISKFTRELKAQGGPVIRMQDENVLASIIHEAKHSDDTTLLAIYDGLKTELKAYLNSSEIDTRVINRLVAESTDSISPNSELGV